MTSLQGIDGGDELGKYRVLERIGDGERALFRAVVKDSGASVCLLELRTDEVPFFASAKRADHAHLARVYEILEHEEALLLVFEDVPGTTLTARLAELGKKPTVDAVGSALRVSDALSTLHDAGGVHGFIHTDSVVLDPPERLGPVLSFAPVPSDERTFHSPERGETGKPSVADDAWAAAGLLHMMLTGEAPPKEGYGGTAELRDAGIEDEALQSALLHGLHREVSERSQDVRPLKRELARWFVEHAGEDAALGGHTHHSTQPPPLPPGFGRRIPGSVQAAPLPLAPRSRKNRVLVLAVAGSVIGLVGAWAFSALRGPKVTLIERPVSSAAAAPLPQQPIDLGDVSVTGEEQTVQLDKTASCVASYLPKGAFARSPDLGWLCEETDAQKASQKLRVAVVTAAPKTTGPTDAMKLFARMDWYDLATHAVVRAGCCTEAKPLALPEPGTGCESMAEVLTDLGREVVAGKSYEEPLNRFKTVVDCEVALGRGPVFGRAARPQAGEDAAFRELLHAMSR